ncbi:hypothetical protein A6A20_01535 [Volucribacter amazonae]|uniref:Uncharacterized protein n=1 Tax=Volucribacter amazonae TaxID=256731 RepID=A0A9X4SH69_9PAST|nr:hypothetical protein [Volucribacter amazonae]
MDWFGLAGCKGKKWDVGSYQQLRSSVKNHGLELDAHHIGQKALMKKLVKNYDPNTGPAILVPKVGHTISKPNTGVVSRSNINPKTGQKIKSARELLARDIKKLKRVYPEIPKSKIREIIKLNKSMYPEMNK